VCGVACKAVSACLEDSDPILNQWSEIMKKTLFIMLCLAAALPAAAASPQQILDAYAAEAKKANPAFKSFSAEKGRAFYVAKQGATGRAASCSTCHTEDPKAGGRHAKTGKDIRPLAPSANAERLSDAAKVEKWFGRNCNDVLGRACTAQEKGDFMSYLMSVR